MNMKYMNWTWVWCTRRHAGWLIGQRAKEERYGVIRWKALSGSVVRRDLQWKDPEFVAFPGKPHRPRSVFGSGFKTRVSAQIGMRKCAKRLPNECARSADLEFIVMRSKYAPLTKISIPNGISRVPRQSSASCALQRGAKCTPLLRRE